MFNRLQQAILLLGMITVSSVHAGSFMVDPVRIDLDASQKSSSLVIRNNDQAPTVIQVNLMAWSQVDGEDVFTPTRDVLLTPPIITIQPGAEQLLRLALRRPFDPQKELTYRVFLQEVPAPSKPGFRGLQVALRMSVPIFANINQALLPKMQWKSDYIAKEHALRVELINSGEAHLHLYEFSLRPPSSNKDLILQQTAVYLLPRQHHVWTLKLDSMTTIDSVKLKLKATTDTGVAEQDLDLGKS
jgi:fimbrial chaperone protein